MLLDGEAKLLSTSAAVGAFGVEHKSWAELWRLLVFNYEKKWAYDVVSIVDMIRNVHKAKNLGEVQPKIATFEWLYLEFTKCFNESLDEDIKQANN